MSQLNNYTLAPIDAERVSEAAGVNSAAGSFGLSFGLAVASLIGLVNSFRTARLPDITPPASVEETTSG